jgi:hypothetical protein
MSIDTQELTIWNAWDCLVKRSGYPTLRPLTYLLVPLEIVARHELRPNLVR